MVFLEKRGEEISHLPSRKNRLSRIKGGEYDRGMHEEI